MPRVFHGSCTLVMSPLASTLFLYLRLQTLAFSCISLMDEKAAEAGRVALTTSLEASTPNMPNPRLPRSRRFLIGLLSLVLPFYIVFSLLSYPRHPSFPSATSPSSTSTVLQANRSRVHLEAHIMSKCPDARDCLRDLVVPAMEDVVDKVNFTLSFIGSYVHLLRTALLLTNPSRGTG